MAPNGIRLAVLAMLVAPGTWAAATPMDAPLKEDGVITIECDVTDKTEPTAALKGLEASSPSAKFEEFHYDLYLPKGYLQNKDHRYPCLFIADAGGNANMGAMAERLKRDRWIVAMLRESRNGSPDWLKNFLAAHDDVVKRARVAKGAKFTTGYSGGARCSSMNAVVRPGMAGVICQAAAFGYDTDLKKVPPYTPYIYPWYPTHVLVAGTFGDKDGNINECHDLRRDLVGSRANILLFDGGHSSCPREVFDSVLDWMEETLFLFPQPAVPPAHRVRNVKIAPPEPPDADTYRWYLRKCAGVLDAAKEPPARYLALGRVLAVVDKGKLGSDQDVAESAKKWQAELETLKATAPIREFEGKALAAYRNARAAEDAYARQMKLAPATHNSKMPMSAEDLQALDRAIAAYGAAAKDHPDSPFAAECKLRLASLTAEKGKTSAREKPTILSAKVVSVIDGNTIVISWKWKAEGKSGSTVRITGYAPPPANTPEGQAAKAKLEQLVLGKQIGVGDYYAVEQGALVNDIYLGGKFLADFFPEY
jgi:hypothetical protein